MRTSAFCFASDLADEGLDAALDAIQHRAGLGGVTMAAAYHASRDLFPHARTRRLRYQPGGEIFFRPDPSRWRGLALQPRPGALARSGDPLAALIGAAGARGLGVQAWTVFLHVDWTEDGDPRFAEQTCFGDPCLTELCPANPDVRAYAVALAGDIAAHGAGAILAESLHHHPLEHGAHHERYFVALGSAARLLLGLCFCAHCLEGARRHGADPEELRRRACEQLERAFAGELEDTAAELSRDDAAGLLGGQLGALLEARCESVTALVGEVAAATAGHGARLDLLDASGAVKGYATGLPEGAAAPSNAWRLGVDVAACAEAGAAIGAIAYAADPTRVALDLAAYRQLAGDAPLVAALRPVPPDCSSAANLAAKLAIARDTGVDRVDIYHYGFAPLSALDRVREALALAGI
ncbi:MAG: hypothetical protein QOI71_15 [Gaiellales bacterium]|nr:hypothetical protein [Gaiellales bacterium]